MMEEWGERCRTGLSSDLVLYEIYLQHLCASRCNLSFGCLTFLTLVIETSEKLRIYTVLHSARIKHSTEISVDMTLCSLSDSYLPQELPQIVVTSMLFLCYYA